MQVEQLDKGDQAVEEDKSNAAEKLSAEAIAASDVHQAASGNRSESLLPSVQINDTESQRLNEHEKMKENPLTELDMRKISCFLDRLELIPGEQKITKLDSGTLVVRAKDADYIVMKNGAELIIGHDGSLSVKCNAAVEITEMNGQKTIKFADGSEVNYGKDGLNSIREGNTVSLFGHRIQCPPDFPPVFPPIRPPVRPEPWPQPRPWPPKFLENKS